MRLECAVLGVPLQGKLKPAKPAKAVINIGKSKLKSVNGQSLQLQVSTASKRNQQPINLTPENITSLISTHVTAGKVTIEFAQPPWRMFISGADPNRLARFVQYLRKIKNGEDPGNLDDIKEVKSTELQAQARLIVDKSKTYNSDYAKNFPTTLHTLSITNCDLSKLDVRWFSNTKLTHLCLADNRLVEGGLKKLVLIKRLVHLQRLDLSNNIISRLPDDIQWPDTVVEINLRNNNFNYIPQSICKIRSLVLLDISLNPIRSLPKMQCWPRLKKLYFNNTWISYMPFYFTRMKLDELRCSNRIASDEEYWNFNSDVEYENLSIPTLESIAAAAVRQSKQNEKILPWTVNMNALTTQCCRCLQSPRSVAVKALAEADAKVEKEATVLCRLDHENIVRLYGLTRDGDRLLLVFGMMRLGDLRSYMKTRTAQQGSYASFPAVLDQDELKFIVRQIAKGLCYLVAQQIVHRDLAARNCLVDGDTDHMVGNPRQRPSITVKISDFGMSRRLNYNADYYRMRPLKLRHCPNDVYALMERCWSLDPDLRATAEDVLLYPAIAPNPVEFVLCDFSNRFYRVLPAAKDGECHWKRGNDVDAIGGFEFSDLEFLLYTEYCTQKGRRRVNGERRSITTTYSGDFGDICGDR